MNKNTKTANIKNNMNGDWNEKNIVNDHNLNKIMSLNYIGNLGYCID